MHTEYLGELSIAVVLLLVAVMAIAGLVHGTLGLGFPMIATPLLSLHFDLRTAILLTLLPTVAVNLVSILRGGQWRNSIALFWPLPLYALLGGFIGASFIADHDPAPFKLLLAFLVLLYLLTQFLSNTEFTLARRNPRKSMLVFGLLAGFAAGATNVMVPLLIIYSLSLGLTSIAMVQVFNMTFLAGKVSQIVVFGMQDFLNFSWLISTTPLAFLGLLALFVGMRIREKIPTKLFQKIMKVILVIVALTLIAQYIFA